MVLKHPYISIENENQVSFGGSQNWFSSSIIKKGGCGRIAGQDLLLYLGRFHRGCQTAPLRKLHLRNGVFSRESYEAYSRSVGKYFPVLPRLGMPVWFLPISINLYCLRYHLPYRARWGCFPGRLFSSIEEMLAKDLPVILSVGQNFPIFWGKKKLTFYQLRNAKYEEAVQVKAHYVTVTGIDAEWLTISSWGKKYYIKKEEYITYVKKHSCWLFSNICYIYS